MLSVDMFHIFARCIFCVNSLGIFCHFCFLLYINNSRGKYWFSLSILFVRRQHLCPPHPTASTTSSQVFFMAIIQIFIFYSFFMAYYPFFVRKNIPHFNKLKLLLDVFAPVFLFFETHHHINIMYYFDCLLTIFVVHCVPFDAH